MGHWIVEELPPSFKHPVVAMISLMVPCGSDAKYCNQQSQNHDCKTPTIRTTLLINLS